MGCCGGGKKGGAAKVEVKKKDVPPPGEPVLDAIGADDFKAAVELMCVKMGEKKIEYRNIDWSGPLADAQAKSELNDYFADKLKDKDMRGSLEGMLPDECMSCFEDALKEKGESPEMIKAVKDFLFTNPPTE